MANTVSLLDEIPARGSVRLAATWDRSWEQFLHPGTGRPGGMVFEVGSQLAADLEVEAEFVDLPWSEQVEALMRGDVDVCLKLTNTPERARRIAFTSGPPLLEYRGVLFKREQHLILPGEVDAFEGRVAVTRGSFHLAVAEERMPAASIIRTASASESMMRLAANEVDAVLTDDIVDHPPGVDILLGSGGEPVVFSDDASYPSTRRGDHDFRLWLEHWMLYRSRQGTIQRLIEKGKAEHREAFRGA